MALLSGEVETSRETPATALRSLCRMALLSGEVETGQGQSQVCQGLYGGSGWLCYPGKLKLGERVLRAGSQLSVFRMALLSGEVETRASAQPSGLREPEFRMALLSGEVETMRPRRLRRCAAEVPDGFAIRGSWNNVYVSGRAKGSCSQLQHGLK